MGDNLENNSTSDVGSLETSEEETIDFILASERIPEVFSSDNESPFSNTINQSDSENAGTVSDSCDNTSILPKEFRDILNSGLENVFPEEQPAATSDGFVVPAIPMESSQVKPVSAIHDDFLHTSLEKAWEQADRLRQQVDQHPGDKKLLEEWHKACLNWSEQNRDIGPIPQVELKPKGGKVGKKGKPPMPKTLKCPFCETWTQNSSALKRHLNLELKNFKPFVCGVCSACFCRRDALKQHCQVHQDRT